MSEATISLQSKDINAYRILEQYADEDGFCEVPLARLADLAGTHKSQLARDIDTLKRNGMVGVLQVVDDDGDQRTVYELKGW